MQSLVSTLKAAVRHITNLECAEKLCRAVGYTQVSEGTVFSERGRIAAHTESRAIPHHALEDRRIIDRDVSRTRAARGDEVNRIRR